MFSSLDTCTNSTAYLLILAQSFFLLLLACLLAWGLRASVCLRGPFLGGGMTRSLKCVFLLSLSLSREAPPVSLLSVSHSAGPDSLKIWPGYVSGLPLWPRQEGNFPNGAVSERQWTVDEKAMRKDQWNQCCKTNAGRISARAEGSNDDASTS